MRKRFIALPLLTLLIPIVSALSVPSVSAATSTATTADTIFGSSTPTTLDSGDASAVNLGVKFSPSANGWITGVRFYKASANTGTHIGSLYSSTGTLLAQATFTGESASGWQNVSFSQPVAVTAGTTYVASYFAPKGHYSVTTGGLASAVTKAPLTALANSSGGNGLYAYANASAFPTSTYQSDNYYVDVDFVPSTAASTIFGSSTPTTLDSGDASAVNLGVKFSPSANGWITGVRFYKASANTGTHIGSLYSSTGTLLAQATFTGESASGWQNVSFSQPVAVTAGTTYVASYFAPKGHYSVTTGGLASAVTKAPLTALANSSGGNGLYAYANASAFPTSTYQSDNYYVDVDFVPSTAVATSGGSAANTGTPPTTTPPTTTTPTTTTPTTTTPTATTPTTTTPTTTTPTATTPTTTTPTTTTPTTTTPTTTTPTTTTPTTPPTGTCFQSPGACGYPDPADGTVGVPAGTQLTASGSLVVKTAGTVIKDLNVSGSIEVSANNVTIEDTKVTVGGGGCGYMNLCGNSDITIDSGVTGTQLVDDTLTNAADGTTVQDAVYNYGGSATTAEGLYVYSQTDPAVTTVDSCEGENNVPGGGVAGSWWGAGTISDSYFTAGLYIACAHVDVIYYPAGSAALLNVQHDTLLNPTEQTSEILADDSQGGSGNPNLVVNGSFLAGGGYAIYGDGHGTGAGTNTITNNMFGRCITSQYEATDGSGAHLCTAGKDADGYFPNGGSYGIADDMTTTFTWTGNVWDNGGTAAS